MWICLKKLVKSFQMIILFKIQLNLMLRQGNLSFSPKQWITRNSRRWLQRMQCATKRGIMTLEIWLHLNTLWLLGKMREDLTLVLWIWLISSYNTTWGQIQIYSTRMVSILIIRRHKIDQEGILSLKAIIKIEKLNSQNGNNLDIVQTETRVIYLNVTVKMEKYILVLKID